MQGEAFAPLLAALPEAVMLITPEGSIRFANRAARELLCGAEGSPTGRRLAEFAADDSAALEAFLRSCARSRELLPGSLALANGAAPRAMRLECGLLQPGSGERAALLLLRLAPKEQAVARFAALNLRIEEMNREIARRRQVEEALRNERELLEVTLASIGDAVIATDGHGQVTFLNPVAERETGWSRAAATGRPLAEVFPIFNEDTRAPVENPVARVLRDKRVVGLANHTLLRRRDGSLLPIDDAGAPILDADGKVLGVVLVFRNITERRAVERERAQAERRKDEFLAMLAHELRNPLAAIGAGVEVVRRMPRPEALAEVSDAMHRQVRHLARLVDDLLDVSRIATGKISLKKARISLNAMVEDVLATQRPAIDAKEIVLAWQPSPDFPQVDGDGERLAQVVGNLVGNAVKFNRRGGRLQVATGVEHGRAFVRVADEGEGIAPEILPAIFDLFMQGDTSLERSRGGLGVGLTVAKLITELHGGRIDAKSEGLGKGAEFTVRLPLHTERASAPPSAPPPPAAGAGRRVLVVDDNADVATSLALLLKLGGHDVRVAYDGATALRMHADSPADVVLLDLGMAGMNGYEVARRLRQRGDVPRPRIFALSGYGADADRARVAEAGFDGHLTKPVDAQTLEALLAGN